MAACPSVRMEQLDSYWMDFHEIIYLKILQKKLVQVWLKSYKNNGYFTWRLIALNSSKNNTYFRKKFRENKNIYLRPINLLFWKSCRLLGYVDKYDEPDRQHMTT
jgi:hypothetical protein